MNRLALLSCLFLFQGYAFAQWSPLNGPETYNAILLDAGKYVLAGTTQGVYRSDDYGIEWEIVPDLPPLFNCHSFSINQDSNQIIVSMRDDACKCVYLYKSNDEGESWEKISTPGFADYFSSIYSGNNAYILVSTSRIQDNQVIHTNWESFDGGVQWRRNFMDTLSDAPITNIRRYGTQLWGFSANKLFKGGMQGQNWGLVASTPDTLAIGDYLIRGDSILMTSVGVLYSKLWLSKDAGGSWTALPFPFYLQHFQEKEGVLFAKGAYDQLLVSYDDGEHWAVQAVDSIHLNDFVFKGDYIIGYEFGTGIVRSEDSGKHFFRTGKRLGYASFPDQMAILDRNLFISDPYAADLNQSLTVHDLSQNTWDTKSSPSQTLGFSMFSDDLVGLDGRLFACLNTHDVLRSDNKGQSWSACTELSQWPQVPTGTRFFTLGNALFLYNTFWSTNFPLYRTTDYGNNWSFLDFSGVTSCSQSGSGALAGAVGQMVFAANRYGNCLYTSADLGNTWQSLALPEIELYSDTGYTYITDITTSDNVILLTIARNDRNQRDFFNFVSMDQGQSWQESNAPIGLRESNANISPVMLEVDSFLLLSTYGAGILISQDSGKHWHPFTEELPGLFIHDLVVDNDFVYASVASHGVWKRPLQDLSLYDSAPEQKLIKVIAGPNPNTGLVRLIALSPIEKAQVMWFDMSGRLCLEENVAFLCQKAVVVLPFANGQYVYRIRTDAGEVATGKVVLIR
ncbi:MAG: hypothetical protein JNN28_08170 [Saprospiraceae bacterium]|nr:hypothetical protein [Saprospiraceae bacterium]